MSLDDKYLKQVYKLTSNYNSIQDNYLKKYVKMENRFTDPQNQAGVKNYYKVEYADKSTGPLLWPGNTFDVNVLNDNTIDKANQLHGSPSLMDGYQSDLNELIAQQNTVYIVSSIAVTTLLIMAIVVGRT
jgi:hypothetical protein